MKTPIIGLRVAARWAAKCSLVLGLGGGLGLSGGNGVLLLARPSERASALALQERDMGRALEAYSLGKLKTAQSGFERLAAKHVGLAQYNLAMMHIRSEASRPNFTVARTLLLKAAKQNVVLAHFALSQVYELGAGLPIDLAETNRWLQSGSELGHTDSQVSLGTNYFLGRGVAKDPERAAHWFRLAATGGDVGAQYLLASQYEAGDGVPQDLRLAAYWYDIAAKNGDIAAPSKLKEVLARQAALN